MSRRNDRLFNWLCAAIACFCLLSLNLPIIVPHHVAHYWSIAMFAFNGDQYLGGTLAARLALSATELLLIYWAIWSIMGGKGKAGLIASIVNLAVSTLFVLGMAAGMRACRPEMLVVGALDAVGAIVLAVIQNKSARQQ